MQKIDWAIYIVLIILLIVSFPKACGSKIPSNSVSYNCAGFKTPLLSYLNMANNSVEWCSGICVSKSIIKPSNKTNSTTSDDSGAPVQISGMTNSFGKAIPSLALVFGIVALLRWISNMQKDKKKGAYIRVYKTPGS